MSTPNKPEPKARLIKVTVHGTAADAAGSPRYVETPPGLDAADLVHRLAAACRAAFGQGYLQHRDDAWHYYQTGG